MARDPRTKRFLRRAILLLPVLIMYGCAPTALPDVAWPEPPDPPRVKYNRDIRGGRDLKPSSIAAEILLGAEEAMSLKKPMGVYVDKSGKIFVTDTALSDVLLLDTVKKDMVSLNSKAKIFFKPIGVATDGAGKVFVTDSQIDKVVVLNEKGEVLSYLEEGDIPFKQPTGIYADQANRKLYVTDTHHHHVKVYDLDTLKYIKTIGRRGKDEGEFNFPSHITVDSRGNLYVVDTMNGRVQIFDSEGRFMRAFGQFGDVPGMFARPKGIAVDSEGHIYVVDAAFNNVQIFDDEGQILMSFASYGNDRGQLILPAGVSIDKDDFIYVVDSWNRRLAVYEYLGKKAKARGTTVKGKPIE